MNYKDYIRIIPDYPQPGIRFKDITTLTNNGPVYAHAIDAIRQAVADKQIDLVAGPEARGFIIGAPLAVTLGAGFVPIRKSGKLPGEVIEASYDLEYGNDKLAIHKDAIKPGQRVLIADDLLATGGTIATTINLIRQLGGEVVGAAFLIELGYLDGRKKLDGIDIFSLMTY
ncbi:adenine phosphoribosyltransferase [Paenibacillus lignilyticus]|uniref:Adenine phosphoribosyltransferase n=1 Tax=Paenibacillus lignilyticus TaxID=1172615 RepID=A0ABS5C5Z3_9BACL|nr:adenine phosphoribosyltransferase [Paenibacillus lignilyticus]MBP3961369.1 adenine phosphoribosyltransferase [Paenibacillus lignilyticus]